MRSYSLLLTRFTRCDAGEGANPRLLRRTRGEGVGHAIEREERMAAERGATESENPLEVRKRGREHLCAFPPKKKNLSILKALIVEVEAFGR